jgi:hypothetical protein
MTKFYNVANGAITTETTLDEIKAAGLKKSRDIVIGNENAVAYTAGGPDAPIAAVLIYAAG